MLQRLLIMRNSIFKPELLESLALRICLQIQTHILESACYLNSLPQINCFCLVPAAAFFVTYESTKLLFTGYSATNLAPFTHMLAASLGEIVGFLLFFFFLSCLSFYLLSFIYPLQPKWTVCLFHRQICRRLRMCFLLAVFCLGLGAGPQTTLYFPTSWPNRILLLSIDIAVFIERSLAVWSREILKVLEL